MTQHSGPVYEITFLMDREFAADFDGWFGDHVDRARRDADVVDCNGCAMADADGRARRLCLYELADDDGLDRFLEHFGGHVDNEVDARFGNGVQLRARVLREDAREELSGGSPDCLNCGAYLRGQYCAVCGQRARSRLISLWELVSDAFGDLFELDSRLWRTVLPLLFRPGRLTYDYLQGRRARYMPPFRMYLVLSLLFFVVAFFNPQEDLGLLFEPAPATETASGETGETGETEDTEEAEEAANHGFVFQVDESGTVRRGDADCEIDPEDLADLPGWLQRRLTPERLLHICERMQIDGGRAFFDKMLDNVPAALIVLLPLMAFVLSLLYPLSRRYYVEHLLFFVHFHAFFFLVLTVQIALTRFAGWLHLPDAMPILAVVAISFYVPVYLYKSMRRVYGQGGLMTFVKYLALLVAYVAGFLATMLGAVALAAISI